MALVYPLVGSLFLLLFFYYFSVMSLIMFFSVFLTSLTSLAFVMYPLIERYLPRAASMNIQLCCLKGTLEQAIVVFFSCLILILWMVTGHWLFNNLIGLSLCVLSICVLRIPSLKIVAIGFVALFIYDIFWVFFSERFFGENVMLKVATTAATNPMDTISQTLGLSGIFISKLQLPMKVIWGNRLLGLGDIVIPGALVAFAAKLDHIQFKLNYLQQTKYFKLSFIGYCVGLAMAMNAALLLEIAQPALLYLVPSTLLPVLYHSYSKQHLPLIWGGFAEEPVV
uniref:Signal peptide peptidase-like 3 n=1 Tax=Arcella intermedia TaxID=1963864 RepID=A0A6B2LCX6_9EUKA